MVSDQLLIYNPAGQGFSLCHRAIGNLGSVSEGFKSGAGAGFKPVERFLQACVQLAASVNAETADTQLRTQKLAELQEVIEAWPKLSAELRTAVLAVTRTVTGRRS